MAEELQSQNHLGSVQKTAIGWLCLRITVFYIFAGFAIKIISIKPALLISGYLYSCWLSVAKSVPTRQVFDGNNCGIILHESHWNKTTRPKSWPASSIQLKPKNNSTQSNFLHPIWAMAILPVIYLVSLDRWKIHRFFDHWHAADGRFPAILDLRVGEPFHSENRPINQVASDGCCLSWWSSWSQNADDYPNFCLIGSSFGNHLDP